METVSYSRSSALVVSIIIGIALVISSIFLAGGLRKIKSEGEAIKIKGYAQKEIMADFAQWTVEFQTNMFSMSEGYDKLERDKQAVMNFLYRNNIGNADMEVSPVSVYPVYRNNEQGYSTGEIVSYNLSQRIQIESKNVNLIKRISSESSKLIKEGIQFVSYQPRYLYTKIDKLKLEMLGAATRDARQRAEVMAKESDTNVGSLKSATQGVFQITSRNSNEISDYGQYDESSIEKKITAVVTVEYLVK